MLGKSHLAVVMLAVLVLTAALMVPEAAFAISGPPPPISVKAHYDLDTAKGFEKVGYPDPNRDDTPVFVLRRGSIGTINITVASQENRTVFADFSFGGHPPYTDVWFNDNFVPDGVTYSIEPSNITLAPRSNVTVTMRIAAAPETAIRSYNLALTLRPEYYPSENPYDWRNYNTILTIVESNPPYTSSTVKSTTIHVTETATYSSTATTTVVTTLTNLVTDPSTYAWAISATTAAATLLAVIILLRRRRRG